MTQMNAASGELNAEQEYFFRAAQRGVLVLNKCQDTGNLFWYPREASPFTGGPTQWVECKGTGEIYSCSLAVRAEPPYCIAYVRLDEGPLILTNIIADDLRSVSIGQRVEVVFRAALDGHPMPFFTPVTQR